MRYYKLDANGNKLFAPIIITPEQAKRSGVINNILLPDGTTTLAANLLGVTDDELAALIDSREYTEVEYNAQD